MTDIYSLTFLEARSLKSGCWQDRSPSDDSGEILPFSQLQKLPASGSAWCFLAFNCITPLLLLFSMCHLFFFFYLFFIFGYFGSLLLCMGFLQLQRAGVRERASYCGGFSCCRARALGAWASVVVAHGLSSCGSRAQLLRGMWDPPRPGLEPVSPALAGGFLTTAPPGKPHHLFL